MIGIPSKEILGKKHDQVVRWRSIKEGIPLTKAEEGGWPLTPNAALYIEGDLERSSSVPLPVGITYAPLLYARWNADQYHRYGPRYYPFPRGG